VAITVPAGVQPGAQPLRSAIEIFCPPLRQFEVILVVESTWAVWPWISTDTTGSVDLPHESVLVDPVDLTVDDCG
jgi:hypothetical protein